MELAYVRSAETPFDRNASFRLFRFLCCRRWLQKLFSSDAIGRVGMPEDSDLADAYNSGSGLPLSLEGTLRRRLRWDALGRPAWLARR